MRRAGWTTYGAGTYRTSTLQDGNVQVWAYEEDFDNWEETYGLDSVLAVYHFGHGGMDGNGVFFAPLGGTWDNRSDALSTNMRLGNEVVNYVFWSTCWSLRVKDGHNPIRTWHDSNLGFRMLFGFETTSVDDGDYGRFFWEEYNRPKSVRAGLARRLVAHLTGAGAVGGGGRSHRPGSAREARERAHPRVGARVARLVSVVVVRPCARDSRAALPGTPIRAVG